jgi:hypothetical protein
MKIVTKISVTLLAFIFLIVACINEKDKISWIDFEWVADTIGGEYHENVAMLIPLKLEGCSREFTMQFDLGASLSSLYENPLKPFLDESKVLSASLDTLNRQYNYNGKKMGTFKNIDLQLDRHSVHFDNIVYYEDYGKTADPDVNKQNKIRIGTIGADVFRDKILIIDYPGSGIAIEDSIPSSLEGKVEFVEYKPMGTRMRIPLEIDGKETFILFDTGASIFPLQVSQDRFSRYADTLYTCDTISVRSWGNYIKMWSAPLNSEISFAGMKLKADRVYVNSQPDFKNFCDWNGFEGLTGNALFMDKMLIIDSRNNRIGIVTDPE